MRLESERLVLREYVADDLAAVLAYQQDPRYLRYYAWSDRSVSEVRAFLRHFIAWQSQEPRYRYQLAITLKDGPESEVIGSAGIRQAAPGEIEAELGYELSPEHWRHGYAIEAARAMVRFAFDDLELHRVWSSCLAQNEPSQRVLRKLGMTLEGRLRENKRFKGRYWDTLIYGLLAP